MCIRDRAKAVISVLILYYAVFHWNDFFNALLFNSNAKNAPLQIILREILLLNQAFSSGVGGVQGGYAQGAADQVKYAVIIVCPNVSTESRIKTSKRKS